MISCFTCHMIIMLNIFIIMLSPKKRKETTTQPRPPLGMNLIKLNSFLFKKQKQKLSESINVSTSHKKQDKSYTNNRSLRIRFKSQIIQFNKSPEEVKTKTSTRFSNLKQGPHNLTLRILKWSKLKKKNSTNRFDYHLFKDKLRDKDLSDKSDIEIIKEINLDRDARKSTHNSLGKKQNLFWNQSQTMKIIQSYKLTQKIVFYQQLQQKKDKQRYAQIPQRNFQADMKSVSRVFNQKQERLRVCRPWSGQSMHTEAHQK